MSTATLIVGLVGACLASGAPSSAMTRESDRSVERTVVEDVPAVEDASSIFSHRRGSDSEAEETRSLARVALGRVERKLGPSSSRSRTDQPTASIALRHRQASVCATRELRKRLTLFCIWVV